MAVLIPPKLQTNSSNWTGSAPYPGSTLHAPRSLRSTARAFNLLELMIVIVLIGILSAAILPEMRGTYEEALLRSTSRKLIGVFQLANSRAITLRETQTVRLDRKNGRFFLEGAVPHGEERGRLQPVRNVPGCAGELDPRIAIELRKLDEDPLENPDDEEALAAKKMLRSQGDAIAFYPDGTAESGEVRLKDRAGFRLALRISATTARVTLVDLGPE